MRNLIHSLNYTGQLLSLLVLSVLVAAISGCNANPPLTNPIATYTPENPVNQEGLDFLDSTLLTPTLIIQGISTPKKINLDTNTYNHPDGLFTMLVPKMWTIDQDMTSVSLNDPASDTSLKVQIVNTGYPLESESLINLVRAREMSELSVFENTVEIDRQVNEEDKSIYIIKKVTHQGREKTLITLYHQKDQAALILDFLFNHNEFNVDQKDLTGIINSVEINPDIFSHLPIDSNANDSIRANGYFSIEIPVYWISERTSGEFSSVDTFYAPDNRAIAQTLIYDDGQSLSRRVAGQIVLATLRENYAKDIIVVKDRVLPDGREELTWKSINDSYEGITIFETRGSALLVLSVMRENDPENYYQGILDDIISSYTIISSDD